MTNVIDAYNPTFFGQEALPHLRKALGMGNRVYRGYDEERKSANEGETIRIRKPSLIAVSDGGTKNRQDLKTSYTDITLGTWKQTQIALSDKELAYTGERIISDHIAPAAYALANQVDADLVSLAKYVPWSYDASASIGYSDLLGARRVLREQAGTIVDMGDNHFAIDPVVEEKFLGLDAFANASYGAGTEGLLQGSIGQRAGIQPFVNQNLSSHTSGTVVSAGTDTAGALGAAGSEGDETINLSALSLVETLKKGDSFVIAGNTQRYAVAADATLAAGANAAVSIFPALVQDYDSGSVVTFEDGTADGNHADKYNTNILFSRHAFALAFAPLAEIGNGAGANMSVINDADNQMSIRSRISYDNDLATVVVTLDILYGIKCLDPNMAVIFRRDLA